LPESGDHQAPMTSDSAPSATVVVPTRDRPAELGRCLDALRCQTLAGLEILVVDDGSRDSGAVEAVVARRPEARIVRGRGNGPAAARNAGASEARGEVVCFVDDDCEPGPRWAELLAAAASAAGRPAAGRTLNGLRESRLAEATQAIVDHLQLASLDPTGLLGFAPSSNLAAPAALTRELPFDESYPLAAGEDRDWGRRAVEHGMAPRYVPGAVVVHRHRLKPAGFLRQHLAYGRGAARLARGHRKRGVLLGGRARLGLIRAGFGRGPGVGALVCLAQLATAAGFALELVTARAAARPEGRRGRRR
jgi:GT2 family glycosyltransferase